MSGDGSKNYNYDSLYTTSEPNKHGFEKYRPGHNNNNNNTP